jgi:K+-transporting ATPase ATPase C chain
MPTRPRSSQLLAAVRVLAVLTVLCGLAYPLLVTGISQIAFAGAADGSLVRRDGQVVGSALIGQNADGPQWFHPRPSAAGEGYDGAASSASNLGPSNPDLLDTVARRAAAYREENGLDADANLPVDAVTASGSGLDPHISVANARLQAPRVSEARGLPVDQILELVDEHTDGRDLGFLGDPGVNVLELNLAVDALDGRAN